MVDRILDWVEDTRMTQKVVILLLFAGFTSMILFQFVVEPQRERVHAFQQTLRSLDHQLGTMKRERRLEALKDEIANLTRQIKTQQSLLTVSTDQMLTGVLDKARSVEVAVTSWKSENPVPLPDTKLNRVTLRLHAEGRYHALGHFLEELQTLPNTLTLKSLDFHARERSETSPERPIQASFELISFQATAVKQGGRRDVTG